MNDPAELLLRDAEAILVRSIRDIKCSDCIGVAFLAWLLGPNNIDCSLNEIFTATKNSVEGASRTYRDISTLGYLHASGMKDQQSLVAFESGLTWLCGCSAFIDGIPVGFATDAIALLGVSLGAVALGDDSKVKQTISWLQSFSETISSFSGVDEYQRSLISAAHVVLGAQKTDGSSSRDCANIRIALQSKNIFLQSNDSDDSFDTIDMTINGVVNVDDPHRAAFQLAAIRWLRRSTPRIVPNQATIDQVAAVLHNLPFALRRWTWEDKPKTRGGTARKWHIDHEYHFQNLLWSMLAPIFPDLTYEEFTPLIATYQPRSDIAIPSLKLIIEAKFWREGTSIKDLVEQISADSGLYFVEGARYAHLLPVIWDDARRSEDHHLLRTGLKKLPRVVDAVIVGKPGFINTL